MIKDEYSDSYFFKDLNVILPYSLPFFHTFNISSFLGMTWSTKRQFNEPEQYKLYNVCLYLTAFCLQDISYSSSKSLVHIVTSAT